MQVWIIVLYNSKDLLIQVNKQYANRYMTIYTVQCEKLGTRIRDPLEVLIFHTSHPLRAPKSQLPLFIPLTDPSFYH